ncbi:MAG: 50S ribosomal protein L25 [Desulfobulbales bacterium]|nr:50S ribosomal protein L25 [Desulfobulbales bacterium]
MTAEIRQDFGKGAAHRLRQSGYAPVIMYGKKAEPVALAMDAKTLTRDLLQLHGHNVVINLEIEGEKGKKKHHVLIKDIQTDPVTDTILHVDFFEIDMDKEIVLDVAVLYTGTAKGVDMGGILNIMAHTVKIKGLPLAIPDEINVDVTPLELTSQGITCADLEIPEGVTLEEDMGRVCVSIVAPMAEVEEEVEEEEEGVEAEEGAEAPAEAEAKTEEPAASSEE